MDILVTSTRFYICLGKCLLPQPFLCMCMMLHIVTAYLTTSLHVCTGSLLCMSNLGQDYCKQVFPESAHARVHIYSLAIAFRIWSKPHYRAKSFQHDLIANLSNVAIPGTGKNFAENFAVYDLIHAFTVIYMYLAHITH